jgi:hypothetical protein
VGVLSRAAVIVALFGAGCYEPTVSDCALTCAEEHDCAGGQVCADGWCVSPEAVGSCRLPAIDGGAEPDAAAPRPDAMTAPLDAGVVQLHVLVQGRGKVVIDPLGEECVGTNNTPGDCAYELPPGTTQTLLPVQTHQNWPFAGWTTENCSGEPGACTLVIDDAVVLVSATFQ